MASIYKNKNGTFRVTYDEITLDNNSKRAQRQKTFKTETEALDFKKKVEMCVDVGISTDTIHPKNIELKQVNCKVLAPKDIRTKNVTLSAFYEHWLEVFARAKWKPKTYEKNTRTFRFHILPVMGMTKLDEITAVDIEFFISSLAKKRVSGPQYAKVPESKRPFLTVASIKYCYTMLRQIFYKAVEWDFLKESPVKCKSPSEKDYSKNQKIKTAWNAPMLGEALGKIYSENFLLYLSLHLAFACSLRPQETHGLTW